MKDLQPVEVLLEVDESVLSWKNLRDVIRSAVDTYVNGARFIEIHTMRIPDPYLFADPDNRPEGLE